MVPDHSMAPAASTPLSRTVLVVDDDPGIRETVTEVLSSEGYRVIEAGDGQEALRHLDGFEDRCVVLLDLVMPRMNGLEVRTSVLVMSANVQPGELEFPHVVAVLRKPFELDDLLRWVEVCSRPPG